MSGRLDPPNTPTADEKALLARLLTLDAELRAVPTATHLGQDVGDGLITFLRASIIRQTGAILP